MTDGLEICKSVASLHGSIMGTGIIEGGTPVAMHIKPGTPLPNPERFETMFSQAEIVVSIFRTNEDHFGRLHYLMSHHENSDLFFFPLLVNGRKMNLVVRVAPPYQHESFVDSIRQYLGEMRIARR